MRRVLNRHSSSESGVPVVQRLFLSSPSPPGEVSIHLERQANGFNVKQGSETVNYANRDSKVKEMIGYS